MLTRQAPGRMPDAGPGRPRPAPASRLIAWKLIPRTARRHSGSATDSTRCRGHHHAGLRLSDIDYKACSDVEAVTGASGTTTATEL